MIKSLSKPSKMKLRKKKEKKLQNKEGFTEQKNQKKLKSEKKNLNKK